VRILHLVTLLSPDEAFEGPFRVGLNQAVELGSRGHDFRIVAGWRWVGEGAWLLNLEPIHIGRNVRVSQDLFLCTGSHERRSRTFEFDNGSIVLGDGAWVPARATVRGIMIGHRAVVGAAATVLRDVPRDSLVLAGPRFEGPG
jgi:putative colanic acid biosynthesis acetyltransferase WcaF